MLVIDGNKGLGIDESGFMDESDFNTPISIMHNDLFQLFYETNLFMYKIYDSLSPNANDLLELFFVGVYIKIHKSIQSAAILLSRGLEEETKIMLRSVLDKLFIMRAIYNNKDNYDRLLSHQNYERRHLNNDIKNKLPGLENLNYNIKDLPKGKRTSMKQWAKLANMEAQYNVVYRLFSTNIHCSLSSLESDLSIKDGFPYMIDICPHFKETTMLLLTIINDAFNALDIIVNYFDLDKSEYNSLEDSIRAYENNELKKLKIVD